MSYNFFSQKECSKDSNSKKREETLICFGISWCTLQKIHGYHKARRNKMHRVLKGSNKIVTILHMSVYGENPNYPPLHQQFI